MDKNKLKNFLAAEMVFVLCCGNLIFAMREKSAFYLVMFWWLLENFTEKIKCYKNNGKTFFSLPFYVITSIFLHVVFVLGVICKLF